MDISRLVKHTKHICLQIFTFYDIIILINKVVNTYYNINLKKSN
jgi:hypothetical protein